MNRDPRNVLVKPLMTEKSMQRKEELNAVTFRVSVDANKVESAKPSRRSSTSGRDRRTHPRGQVEAHGQVRGSPPGGRRRSRRSRPATRSTGRGSRDMGIRTLKPTSPARRYALLTNERNTKTPEKSLLSPRSGERAKRLRAVTVRHRKVGTSAGGTSTPARQGRYPGGGHVSSTTRVARRARAPALQDGEKREIIASGSEPGDVTMSGPGADILPGNARRSEHPAGPVHLTAQLGRGGQPAGAPGSPSFWPAEGDTPTSSVPGEVRQVARAYGNGRPGRQPDHENVSAGLAGRAGGLLRPPSAERDEPSTIPWAAAKEKAITR
jgi:hypothetical protein